MSLAVERPRTILWSPIAQHRPVRFHTKVLEESETTRAVFSIKPLPSVAPTGARNRPPDWEPCLHALQRSLTDAGFDPGDPHTLEGDARAKALGNFSKAYDLFAENMKLDLEGIFGTPEKPTRTPGLKTHYGELGVAQALRTPSNPKPSIARAIGWAGARVSEAAGLFRARATVLSAEYANPHFQPTLDTNTRRLRLLANNITNLYQRGIPFPFHYPRGKNRWHSFLKKIGNNISKHINRTPTGTTPHRDNVGHIARESADLCLWLNKTTAWISQARKIVLAHEWETSNASWTDFCELACEGGAKAGHAYVRAPVPWTSDPTRLGEEGEEWSACITARLARERQCWKECWGATEEPHPASYPSFNPFPLKPRVSADLVCRASSGFKNSTCTPDGVHPKHFSLLSAGGLEALTWVIWAIDVVGQMPSQTQEVQVELYPKPEGGLRPIGFFRAVFRLWGKTKKSETRTWERDHGTHRAFSMSPGVGATDPVWRQAIRSEHATGSDQAFVALLWDIKLCYEHVLHSSL